MAGRGRAPIAAPALILASVLTASACGNSAHNRSYQYGSDVMRTVVQHSAGTGDARRDCRRALVAHPATFPGYDLDNAVDGCVDEWDTLNT